MDIKDLKFDKNGYVCSITQDALTGEVLMQAYMNKEAIEMSLKTGYAHYFSRSRNKLWKKGEESGNFQKISEILYDCDCDCLLLKVIQQGVACHTGEYSCFYRQLKKFDDLADYKILMKIIDIVKDRKDNPKEGSYTNYLFEKGIEKICKKIGEEATETVIASIANKKNEATNEIADLYYHLIVLMQELEIDINEVYKVLEKREGKTPHPKYSAK